ncbi:MAG: nucleotide sugar dehydrogenase [Candidatus Diapherotrites archaeon]|nr:nucleotide sugar dehydrogenase [Candidatus Diapherotrites archaeon]
MPERVCIIGLGYVGLPLACLCVEKGFEVKGFDIDRQRIEKITRGVPPIRDSFLEKTLPLVYEKIKVSSKQGDVLPNTDIFIVAVPTPAEKSRPDLKPLKSACRAISKFVSKNSLVIIESTIYPGTVEEIVLPILEKSGLKCSQDFLLGHCPERIDPGNKKFVLQKIPRVLACTSPEGNKKALDFYRSIIDADIMVLNSVREAEAVKVVENTFRDINIAYVNELAKSFEKMKIDLPQVIRGASTKPFGYMPFYPGPGVGGHCIAQDPYYLISKARKHGFEHSFLKLARKINNSMPAHVVGIIESALAAKNIKLEDSKICILGLSYKPDIDDTRESPSLKIVDLLLKKRVKLKIFDPFLPKESNVASLIEAIAGCNCIVLCAHHSQFVEKLSPEFLAANNAQIIVDTHNVLDKKGIQAKGIVYKGVGA